MNSVNSIRYRIEQDLLFWIVSCISENSREDSTRDTITTRDKYSVCVGFHKGFVEHEKPDLLHKIYLEEAQNFGCRRGSVFLKIKVLDGVRELVSDNL